MNSPISPSAVTSPVPARLVQLRAAMRKYALDAYIIPTADPHLSEYLAERWQGRERYSGFTGSMATLIVTADFAGLWVDSRYWEQAENELAPTGIQLMKIPSGASVLHLDWLAANMRSGQVVGVDGAVLGLAGARALQAALAPKGTKLDTSRDLLEEIWEGRPGLPAAPIYEHATSFAPTTRASKLALVREQMRAKGADWHFISTVDDLAWIFNLRGTDVSYNPVFLGHALIGLDQVSLFVSAGKIAPELQAKLAADGVAVLHYGEAASALSHLPAAATLLVDPRRITYGFRQAVPSAVTVIEAVNPSTFAKSRKTAAEAQFVREAMEQDGAALCEVFAWFDQAQGKERITELTIAEKLLEARQRQPHFITPSFGTIAGFNPNGAMPHYHATEESHAVIEGEGLLLVDSGGQYLNGTTDITRVLPVGQANAEQKRDFTLVLKGMIALSRANFPKGTLSPLLDTLARAPIWAEGVNYGHGTGHGVGYFLNVHEGPQSISYLTPPEPHTAMEAGMITSNEPGIYRPGKWGVRIENLVLAVPSHSGEFGDYLKFETLTLCPIDTRCLDLAILRGDELAWLNDYHATVLQRVSPRVSGAALAWLQERTKPVRF